MERSLIPFPQKPKKKKAARVFVAAAFLIAVALAAYFFFPASAKSFISEGSAIAIRSWQETFGTVPDDTDSYDVTTAGDGDDASGTQDIFSDGTGAANAVSASGTASVKKSSKKTSVAASASGTDAPAQTNAMKTQNKNTSTTSGAAISSGVGNIGTAETNSSSLSPVSDAGEISATASPVVSVASPPSCTISASAVTSRKIILNEIAWMGSVAASGETASAAAGREWIELKNISGDAVDLSGWQIDDVSGNLKIVVNASTTAGASTVVPPGGFYLLARGANAVPEISADLVYSGALSNAGDVLAVFDPACGSSDVLDAGSARGLG